MAGRGGAAGRRRRHRTAIWITIDGRSWSIDRGAAPPTFPPRARPGHRDQCRPGRGAPAAPAAHPPALLRRRRLRPRRWRAKARNQRSRARRRARPGRRARLRRTSPPGSGISKICPAGSSAAKRPIPITTSPANTSGDVSTVRRRGDPGRPDITSRPISRMASWRWILSCAGRIFPGSRVFSPLQPVARAGGIQSSPRSISAPCMAKRRSRASRAIGAAATISSSSIECSTTGLINSLDRNKAIKYAALRDLNRRVGQDEAGFSEVSVQAQRLRREATGLSTSIVVIFHKPGASGSGSGGGRGPAPPTSQGSPGPASPGRQSSAGDIDPAARPSSPGRPRAIQVPAARRDRRPHPRQPRGPSPPGPPRPAGPGGGGGGRRGPGVRALTAREAAGIRPEVQLARTRRGDWAISWITSRDLYRAAWRDATGGQGGDAPPHGFLDRDHNQIVVFKPPTNVNVIARARLRQGPAPAEQPRPSRPTTVPGVRREPAPARPTPPAQLPHDTDHPEVRGGWFDWLWGAGSCPSRSSASNYRAAAMRANSHTADRAEFGVFEAVLPDGQTVAVKIYPDEGGSGDANQRERFRARDGRRSRLRSRTRSGPRFSRRSERGTAADGDSPWNVSRAISLKRSPGQTES